MKGFSVDEDGHLIAPEGWMDLGEIRQRVPMKLISRVLGVECPTRGDVVGLVQRTLLCSFGEAIRRVNEIAEEHPDELDAWNNEYDKYMHSDTWRARRGHVLQQAHGKCVCRKKAVSVHHWTYDRLGDELDEDLQALCWRCHRLADVLRKRPDGRQIFDSLCPILKEADWI